MEERSWQKEAHKVIDRCNSNDKHNAICVNACVGSGKTNVASYALGSFIMQNRDKKTAQMFVTPRIRLCAQQYREIKCYLIKCYLKKKFNLVRNVDYTIYRKDCSVTEEKLDLLSNTFTAQHAIFVVCDESLWGKDINSPNPDIRWYKWIHFFNNLEKKGYLFGNAIFDEAHNFTNEHDKIGE